VPQSVAFCAKGRDGHPVPQTSTDRLPPLTDFPFRNKSEATNVPIGNRNYELANAYLQQL